MHIAEWLDNLAPRNTLEEQAVLYVPACKLHGFAQVEFRSALSSRSCRWATAGTDGVLNAPHDAYLKLVVQDVARLAPSFDATGMNTFGGQ